MFHHPPQQPHAASAAAAQHQELKYFSRRPKPSSLPTPLAPVKISTPGGSAFSLSVTLSSFAAPSPLLSPVSWIPTPTPSASPSSISPTTSLLNLSLPVDPSNLPSIVIVQHPHSKLPLKEKLRREDVSPALHASRHHLALGFSTVSRADLFPDLFFAPAFQPPLPTPVAADPDHPTPYDYLNFPAPVSPVLSPPHLSGPPTPDSLTRSTDCSEKIVHLKLNRCCHCDATGIPGAPDCGVCGHIRCRACMRYNVTVDRGVAMRGGYLRSDEDEEEKVGDDDNDVEWGYGGGDLEKMGVGVMKEGWGSDEGVAMDRWVNEEEWTVSRKRGRGECESEFEMGDGRKRGRYS